MGTTFSLPGQPSNYIQVNEVGLKKCLTNQTDKNVINDCINKNIIAPSNNTHIGVNPWNGNGLPPNPACPTKQISILTTASTDSVVNGTWNNPISTTASTDSVVNGTWNNPISTTASTDSIVNGTWNNPILTTASINSVIDGTWNNPISATASINSVIDGTWNNPISISNYQNIDNFNLLNKNVNSKNITLLIIIIVTLLIVLMTK